MTDPSADPQKSTFIQNAAAAFVAAPQDDLHSDDQRSPSPHADRPNPIRHSVCRWCYQDIPLETICEKGKRFGLQSVELLEPADLSILKKYDMSCAMITNPTAVADDGKTVGGIPLAWNRPQYHDILVTAYEQQISAAHRAGAKNVICFSGNRDGMSDEEGLQHCANGLRRLIPQCEELGMTLSMELLNSKVDHPDYMCDRTHWGVNLCRQIASEQFKLLYDIYHMQIMEGDVIATIEQNHSFISHFHTGGVPGRNEIDQSQELYYPAIASAISKTGYQGFVGQEFIPIRDDKLASLERGIKICTV